MQNYDHDGPWKTLKDPSEAKWNCKLVQNVCHLKGEMKQPSTSRVINTFVPEYVNTQKGVSKYKVICASGSEEDR